MADYNYPQPNAAYAAAGSYGQPGGSAPGYPPQYAQYGAPGYPQPQYGGAAPTKSQQQAGGYPQQNAYPSAYQGAYQPAAASTAGYPSAVPVGVAPSYGQPKTDQYGAAPYAQPQMQADHSPHHVVIDYQGPGAAAAKPSEAGAGGYVAQAEKAVRMGFIRKVYSILSVQLLVTFGMVALFTFHEGIKHFVQTHPGILISAFVLSFGFLIALTCCPNVAIKYPTNYLCLAGFTITEGYLVGASSSFYGGDAVIKATVCCFVITIALTIFACQTKIDFTMMGGMLFSATIALILFGLMCGIFRSALMDNVYAGIGAALFSMYIVYDTQLIVGGAHHQHKFTIDMYVFAALNLYIDIVQLFLYLLRLFGNNRD